MNIGCVYHSIDLDGWMSAAIVKHWFKNFYKTANSSLEDSVGEVIIEDLNKFPVEVYTLTFIGYNYGEPIPDLSQYDKIIMCDISFPKGEMEKLFNVLDVNLIWIDHHISAFKDVIGEEFLKDKVDLSTKYNGLRDLRFAACELTWNYLFPNEGMPEIVRLLGRYDCFGHKGTDEELKVLEFQYGARQCISNYEEAHNWLHNCVRQEKAGTLENYIWLKGNNTYEYLCTEAKQTYKNGFKIGLGQSSVKLVDLATIPDTEPETLKNAVGTFLPYKFICINKERFNPINFGIDYHKNGYDGCACFHFDGTHWCFSLYNDNGTVDCSVIAKQFGGGGHKGAAGFVLSPDDFNRFMATNI